MDNYLVSGPVTTEMIGAILKELENDKSAGGHSVFIGQVRADVQGTARVKAIEYTAYEKMVEAEAQRITDLIFESFSGVRSVKIIHSTGVVAAGEISLFIVVSAVHRHDAITACSEVVELVKEKLPVWKKELYDDDTSRWKEDIIP